VCAKHDRLVADNRRLADDNERLRNERNQFEKDRDAIKATADSTPQTTAPENLQHRTLAAALGLTDLDLTYPQLVAAAHRMREQLGDVRTEAARLRRQLENAHGDLLRENRPVDGAPAFRSEANSARVRRAQDHARRLHERLHELTLANQNCTCQREGAAS
jgi:hypothetical protein